MIEMTEKHISFIVILLEYLLYNIYFHTNTNCSCNIQALTQYFLKSESSSTQLWRISSNLHSIHILTNIKADLSLGLFLNNKRG